MPITVLSPHTGKPTKVRDQDVGRSVKDADGHVFYVLEDGEGDYYAALTKVGGQKDIERYRHMAGRAGFTTEVSDKGKPAEVYRHAPAPHKDGFSLKPLFLGVLILAGLAGGAWLLARKGYIVIPGVPADAVERR